MAMMEISLHKRHCVCIGGGAVAERRVERLLDEGALITVISPIVSDSLRAWAAEGKIVWREASYVEGMLASLAPVDFVFVTTDQLTINQIAAKEARAMGAFVNRADDQRDCDFTLPAVAKMGQLAFTISTGKVSPRLNRLVRQDIEKRYAPLAEVLPRLREIRDEVKSALATPKEREEFWHTYLGGTELSQILDGKWNEIEETMNHAISGIRAKS